MSVQQGMLSVWINAFIPGTVAGYTRTVRAGQYAGKTAVPLPNVAYVTNWDASVDQGYLTDQRGFSPNRAASVRMQTSIDVVVTPQIITAHPKGTTTSGTVGVDITSGKVTGRGSANMKRCQTTVTAQRPGDKNIVTGGILGPNDYGLLIDFVSAAADPLVTAAANIDYFGKFQIIRDYAGNHGKGLITVNFYGAVDDFPAFEAYASWNGFTQMLFALPPPKGNTVVNLLGPARTYIPGTVFFT